MLKSYSPQFNFILRAGYNERHSLAPNEKTAS